MAKQKPSIVTSEMQVLEALDEHAAGYVEACDHLVMELGVFTRVQARYPGAHAPVRHLLANHVSNDAYELLSASLRGAGRSMLRSARALFEGAVASVDVPGNDDRADRYTAHRAVTDRAFASLTRLDRHLTKSERRSMGHWRKKVLRDTAPAVEDSVRRWGPRWTQVWAGESLRDRAAAAGLLADSFYRFASFPTHATSGGVIGTVQEHEDQLVHRYGPALQACPVALIYGLTYLRVASTHLGPAEELGDLEDALTAIDGELSAYLDAVLALDAALWPETPPPGPIAVAQIVGGGAKWFLHDAVTAKIVEALPPAHIPEPQARQLDDAIEEFGWGPFDRGRPYTLALIGVEVQPKPGAPWVDDIDRLPRDDFFEAAARRAARET